MVKTESCGRAEARKKIWGGSREGVFHWFAQGFVTKVGEVILLRNVTITALKPDSPNAKKRTSAETGMPEHLKYHCLQSSSRPRRAKQFLSGMLRNVTKSLWFLYISFHGCAFFNDKHVNQAEKVTF